jgi:Flp pilus assembly protein TadD
MPENGDSDPDGAFERAFLESVYKRDPDDPRVLTLLATLYTELGEIDKGLALDLHHVELTPDDPSARYDCACSLSLSGRLDEAFANLDRSLELGFDGTDWMQKDPDLAAARADARWQELLAKYEVAPPSLDAETADGEEKSGEDPSGETQPW